jgi:hypothetical protein
MVAPLSSGSGCAWLAALRGMPEKRLEKFRQERYFQNTRIKGFKQVLEQSDGVLAFLRTNFCFEQRKAHRKWAHRLVEPSFGGGCRIIQVKKLLIFQGHFP